MSNEELGAIKACQTGQTEEFSRLYDAYIRKIYDFIYYKTTHKETAEDLTSVTFMKALEKIYSFSPAKGTFQAWLYQIARHTVIDHYRSKKDAADIADIWDLSGNEDLERDLDLRTKLAAVEKYLAKLKVEQRDIIIMRVWQEMSYAEIAAILGKSEASCKMAYSRAISLLRQNVSLIFIWLCFHL
ncbi:MAG: RNA polymerase sigma factor [Planctomycetes bacterium]|nr:RNA polymerase sigma factor [Planctomycetota bacterium]